MDTPDIQIVLTPALLRDLMDSITIALHHGIKDAVKPRLNQWHFYCGGRKIQPHMTFTFSARLLRDILDAVSIAISRDDLERASRVRLLEWKEATAILLPPEPVQRQTKMRI